MWRVLRAFLVMAIAMEQQVAATFNLFLRSTEVNRLLGLTAELYYVQEGKINTYALEFMMLVPADISELHFTWQNLRSAPMHYAFGVSVSNSDALNQPQLNISRVGIVPVKEEVFRVLLLCTGKVDAEVEVQIQVNITTESNTTSLLIRRNKICLIEGKKNGTALMDASAMVATNSSFFIGVGCASAVIVLITVVAVSCYLRTQKTRRASNYRSQSPPLLAKGQTFLRVDTPNNAASTTSSYASFRRATPLPASVPVQVNDLRTYEVSEQTSGIAIDRRNVSLLEKLQEGTFGQIYHGILHEDESEPHIFVKTVSDQASQVQVSLLLSEGMMMFGTNHRHILPVIAICTDERPLLIYPYVNEGNLKRFLQKCKFSAEGHCHTLLTQDLVAMAIEIVQGMLYLHKRKIVHRDLAARNCVVDEHLHIKITDNALSRDLFPSEYHCLGDNENRPIKWLALESLLWKQFSPASDMWAFGVTLWELMTLGQLPYVEVDPFEMEANLRDGYRLAQPINCPDKLHTLMTCCWAALPDDRPTFLQLNSCLQDFYQALGKYI